MSDMIKVPVVESYINTPRQKNRYAPIENYIVVTLAEDAGRMLVPNAAIDKVGFSAKAPDKLFLKLRQGERVYLEQTPAIEAVEADEDAGTEAVEAQEATYVCMASDAEETVLGIVAEQAVVSHAAALEYNRNIDAIIRKRVANRRR